MLQFITIFLLTQTKGTHGQLTFKRQVIGFDSSGTPRMQNSDNNDNINDFTSQGIEYVHN